MTNDAGTTRPAVWVGHVAMTVSDPRAAHDFFVALGMRTVSRGARVSIAELRGGTHLILLPGSPDGGPAPFDLMVDDLDACHAGWRADGIDVTDVVRGDIHDSFLVNAPDGYVLNVSNSHVVGPV